MPNFIEGLAERIEKSGGVVEEAVEKVVEDIASSSWREGTGWIAHLQYFVFNRENIPKPIS